MIAPNVFTCRSCSKPYDLLSRKPHMIPSCGHTICKECLEKSIERLGEGKSFICVEDQIECSYNPNQFPINQSIYKIVASQELEIKQAQQTPWVKQFASEEEILTPTMMVSNTMNVSNTMIVSKLISSPSDMINDDDIEDQNSNQNNLCKEHKRKLELYCLEDSQSICAICALFGRHKNHNFKQIDIYKDICKEVEIRYQNMSMTLKTMEQKQNEMKGSEQNEDDRINKINNQEYEQISEEFDNLIKQIQERKTQILNEAGIKKKEYIKSQLSKKQQKIQQVNEKADSWKSKTNQLVELLMQTANTMNFVEEIFKPSNANISTLGNNIIQEIDDILNDIQIEIFCPYSFTIPQSQIKQITQNINLTIAGVPSPINNNYFGEKRRSQQDFDQPQNLSQLDSRIDFSIQCSPNRRDKEDDLFNYQQLVGEMSSQRGSVNYENIEQTKYMSQQILNLPGRGDRSITHAGFQASPNQSSTSSTANSKFIKGKDDSFTTLQNEVTEQKMLLRSNKSSVNLRKKSTFCDKLVQKFAQIIENKSDLIEIQQLEMNEEACIHLSKIIKGTKIKVLKILKSKMNDDGLIKLVDQLEYTNIQSIHLQGNMIGDRGLDYLITWIRKKIGVSVINLKSINLNQNQITVLKFKKKIDEIKKTTIINL